MLKKAGIRLRLLLAALLAACFATAAIAQTTTANKPPAQLKPKEPMGCKLVGTVKGTKLWAGDCVLPQNCVVRCRRKRRLYQNALQSPFRPIQSNDDRLYAVDTTLHLVSGAEVDRSNLSPAGLGEHDDEVDILALDGDDQRTCR